MYKARFIPGFLGFSILLALFASCCSLAVAQSSAVSFQAGLYAKSTGSCLDVPGALSNPGTLLTVSACASYAEQYFSFDQQSDASYILHPPESAILCVDLNDSGELVQTYCLPTKSQNWLSVANAGGFYSFVNEQNSQCLTLTPAGSGVAAGFSTAACTATAAQSFGLVLPRVYTPLTITPSNSLPTLPLANPTTGFWQAGMFEGLPYRILFPSGYDPVHYAYPLVLFLHGDRERGTDNLIQLRHDMNALPTDLDFRARAPVILVAPQCPAGDFWGDPLTADPTPTETLTIQLVDTLVSSLSVLSNRVSVTGLSMGGIGSWDMINRYPALFAAAAPIAGYGNIADVPNLVDVPILAVHGSDDQIIPPLTDEQMYAAIHSLGGPMLYYEVAGAGHEVWDDAYPLTAFWQWLYAQQHI